jgi:hypothetical protein
VLIGTLSVGSIGGCFVHCSCSSAMLLSYALTDGAATSGASLVDGIAFPVSSTEPEPLAESLGTSIVGAREEVALVRPVSTMFLSLKVETRWTLSSYSEEERCPVTLFDFCAGWDTVRLFVLVEELL